MEFPPLLLPPQAVRPDPISNKTKSPMRVRQFCDRLRERPIAANASMPGRPRANASQPVNELPSPAVRLTAAVVWGVVVMGRMTA